MGRKHARKHFPKLSNEGRDLTRLRVRLMNMTGVLSHPIVHVGRNSRADG